MHDPVSNPATPRYEPGDFVIPDHFARRPSSLCRLHPAQGRRNVRQRLQETAKGGRLTAITKQASSIEKTRRCLKKTESAIVYKFSALMKGRKSTSSELFLQAEESRTSRTDQRSTPKPPYGQHRRSCPPPSLPHDPSPALPPDARLCRHGPVYAPCPNT